jgi:glycine betaine catabolism B
MKLKLITKQNEAKGTKSFFWEPEKPISYSPGQYLYFTLPKLNYPDKRGATRQFTLSSSPTEGNLLRFTTRIRQESGFKKTLDELPIGSIVDGQGPSGTFIFDEKETGTQIFLAGGIGITPFRSMIKYATDNKLLSQIYLIYSNTDSDIVFKKELDKISKSYQNIKIQYVLSSTEGHLDGIKISKFMKNWQLNINNCTFWLVGPPPFIDAMETILGKLKVSSNKIRSDKFTGY